MSHDALVFLTVKHHFSAGHRIDALAGLGAKCSALHGHTFGVEWTFQVGGLDASEFEFAEAKAQLRAWVDANLDHGFLVSGDDEMMLDLLAAYSFKHYVVDPVPSTEAIASLLLRVANASPIGARCTQVLVTEGPHNEARVVAPR